MLTSQNQIQIKSLILSGLPTNAVSSTMKSIITESLNLTTDSHHQKHILSSAAEYILAYLELGFSYLDHKALFDHVLSAVGYSEEELQTLSRKNHAILSNKTQLQSLLGRWPKSIHNSHTKTQAVDEIIKLVDTMTPGEYRFYTSKKAGTYSTLFILQIVDDCAIIHDVNNNTFFRLIK